MATIAPPNAALFDSDSMEQIYARGTLDRNLAGLSALMMTGAGMKADARREDYMGSLTNQNQLALLAAKTEEASKVRMARMKETSDLLQHGFGAGNLPGSSDLVNGEDPMTELYRAVQQSIVTKNNAEAANAGNKGGAKGGVTMTSTDMPWPGADGKPAPGPTMYQSKAGTPEQAVDQINAAKARVKAVLGNPTAYTPEQQQQARALATTILQQQPHTYNTE